MSLAWSWSLDGVVQTTSSGSHDGRNVNGSMRVAHCVALSPIHYVAVLRLLVCNDSTDASDRVPRACQIGHRHRVIE